MSVGSYLTDESRGIITFLGLLKLHKDPSVCSIFLIYPLSPKGVFLEKGLFAGTSLEIFDREPKKCSLRLKVIQK